MVVLGHRGSGWQSNEWAENSLMSFTESLEIGADGIETDIRLYNDDLILHHDSIGAGGQIHRPTKLVDVLEWADDNFILNLEIKDTFAVKPLIETLKKYTNKKIIISSFWHKSVVKVKEELPFVEAGLIMPFNPIFPSLFKGLIPTCIDIVIWDYTVLDRKLLQALPSYKHFVYNVGNNTVEGLDGIISDNVDLHVSKLA